jgi:DNA-binding transcriptional MerR regulator
MATYRIDDLARVAGTTVRNVRHFQDKGLLPAPRREGRIGWYDDSHLARIRLIGQLQERGYTLATIAELLDAWEHGHDIGDLLGLEQVLTDPWSDELPIYITADELAAMFGPDESGEALRRAEEFGFVEADGDRFRVPDPRLLHVGAELVAAGIPLTAIFDITAQIRADCDTIATRFIRLAIDHGDLHPARSASAADLAEAAAFVRRLRPLAQQAVQGLLSRSMQTLIQARLSEYLETIAAKD